MSTESGSEKPKPDRDGELSKLAARAAKGPEDARSTAEVELEQALASERDGRREDRFLFVVALVVVFDVWSLRGVETWTLPVVVGVIQLFALLILARRMGVEEIHFWLNQLLPRINLGLKKPEDTAPDGDAHPERRADSSETTR